MYAAPGHPGAARVPADGTIVSTRLWRVLMIRAFVSVSRRRGARTAEIRVRSCVVGGVCGTERLWRRAVFFNLVRVDAGGAVSPPRAPARLRLAFMPHAHDEIGFQ